MSEMLTVPTAFGDISDLTEGLADRVDGEQIILYGPTPYDEGAELDFSVLLLDGSPALEGRGRVEASVDGGEDRDPSTRFDIILGSLELGGVAEAVFERMLMARSLVGEGADEPVGEDAPVDEPMADDAPVDEPMADDAPVDEDAAAAEEPAVEEPAVEEPEEAVDSSEPAEASADDGWDAGESAFDDEATVVDDTLGFMEREAQAEAAAAAAAGAAAGDESIASADESAEAPAEEEEAAAAAPAVSPAIAIPTELFPADDAFRGAQRSWRFRRDERPLGRARAARAAKHVDAGGPGAPGSAPELGALPIRREHPAPERASSSRPRPIARGHASAASRWIGGGRGVRGRSQRRLRERRRGGRGGLRGRRRRGRRVRARRDRVARAVRGEATWAQCT
jgi:hypothetical protein